MQKAWACRVEVKAVAEVEEAEAVEAAGEVDVVEAVGVVVGAEADVAEAGINQIFFV